MFISVLTLEKLRSRSKSKIQTHLNSIESKLKIFGDLGVSVLSSIPKSKNMKIAEILQKHHNAEMCQYCTKNIWHVGQTISSSKWFGHIDNHIASSCLLRVSDSSPLDLSRSIKSSPFSEFNNITKWSHVHQILWLLIICYANLNKYYFENFFKRYLIHYLFYWYTSMMTRIHFELGHNLHLTEDIGRLEGGGEFYSPKAK